MTPDVSHNPTDFPDLNLVLPEDPLHERTLHAYPTDPRYRLSGQKEPQIGDIAWCGHLKNIPPIMPRPGLAAVNCPQCNRLRGMR